MSLQPALAVVTDRIRERSLRTRLDYLRGLEAASTNGPVRKALGCTNVAHAFAAAPSGDRILLRENHRPNLAIVPAAIHVTPECLAGGPLARVRNGDLIRLDSDAGLLEADVPAQEWFAREPVVADLHRHHQGFGRSLFASFRANALGAEEGAVTFSAAEPQGNGVSPRAHEEHSSPTTIGGLA